jgi:hypothetical protein
MGDKGATGDTGTAGPAGPRGDAGPPGAPGASGTVGVDGGLTTSCLSPCHGFSGIVEQWKTSTHFATFIANLGGDEVETWTGARTCGNCHAIDGVEQRLAGNVLYGGTDGPPNVTEGEINYKDSVSSRITEASYAGHASVAVVHCTTCHDSSAANDPHLTGEDYSPGSFPLRVPSGADDQARVEKSSAAGTVDGTLAGKYTAGNACICCHKSRKDVTNYITATTNVNSAHWGPHEGPHADIFTGKGGYHYAGNTYNGSSHQSLEKGCVSCHMPEVASNAGVGDHSFYPQLSACTMSGCHAGDAPTSFDINGGQSIMKEMIRELRTALNTATYLTRDGTNPLTAGELADDDFKLDEPNPATGMISGEHAGALYNYLLLARGGAGGIHNPRYTKQLVYDSVLAVTGNPPSSIPARP